MHDKRIQYDFKGILLSPPYIGSLESYEYFCLEPPMGNNPVLPPNLLEIQSGFFTFIVSTKSSAFNSFSLYLIRSKIEAE